jgi:hypothetical protein
VELEISGLQDFRISGFDLRIFGISGSQDLWRDLHLPESSNPPLRKSSNSNKILKS